MKVQCPTCKKTTDYVPENENRPFCSDRCKLIDLGQWADEKFAIPAGPAPVADPNNESEVIFEEGDDPVRH